MASGTCGTRRGLDLGAVRAIRDDIGARVEALVRELG
jgi:hypothetical protein